MTRAKGAAEPTFVSDDRDGLPYGKVFEGDETLAA